ncbi:hypothetical protein Btru_071488 [Bulinus truncatus]|nr:hypothetical protein Btru_071488 [Bulinus truncatus]
MKSVVGCVGLTYDTWPRFPMRVIGGSELFWRESDKPTSTYDLAEWEAIVWLESIASCLAVLLAIMMVVFRIGFGAWKKMSNLNMAMVIMTCFLCSTLAAGLIIYFVKFGKVITRSPDISTQSFPWSTLMCFIAFFFFLLIAALTHFKCRASHYVENAIPFSADSKLALNPSTKNQLMRRYFTPSPYREERRQALSVYSYNDQSFLLGNGTASSRGFEYKGVANGGLKAIEYNTEQAVSDKVDYHYVPVINTLNLPTGVVSGDSVRSSYINGGVSSNRDVVSGNHGSRVVERTYLTTTTTSGGESGHVTHTNRLYQEEEEEMRRRQEEEGYRWRKEEYRRKQEEEEYRLRQEEQHRQWAAAQAEAAQRRRAQESQHLAVKKTVLRENRHDAFSDISGQDVNSDARTIYYTGKDDRSDVSRDVYARVIRSDQHQGGGNGHRGLVTREVVTTRVQPPTPPPPVRHDVTREVTVIEREAGGHTTHPAHFHVSADRDVTEGVQGVDFHTDHIRHQAHEKVVMAPGHLTGDKFKYNGTYIYRPYSEDLY